jgi:hypothetical protein
MSKAKEMTLKQLPKYWDALIKQVKEHEGRIAQLEAKAQTVVPTEAKEPVESE